MRTYKSKGELPIAIFKKCYNNYLHSGSLAFLMEKLHIKCLKLLLKKYGWNPTVHKHYDDILAATKSNILLKNQNISFAKFENSISAKYDTDEPKTSI